MFAVNTEVVYNGKTGTIITICDRGQEFYVDFGSSQRWLTWDKLKQKVSVGS